MDDAEAKQRAIDALIQKFVNGLKLHEVDTLPSPVYGFNPDGWHLFVVDDNKRGTGAAEYVAINRAAGMIRFLGSLGE
jgi:hypothetical protein